ncbi:MAG TPA: helix-turn-helix transcriptional regulator [Parafilimonas sp.]|nr:helix-turn-helix transcriptional regulator [Parafilimonas sp.]
MTVNIGEIIKTKALEKNLSQEKLGRLINKTKQNVNDIFKRKSIDTDLLLKLCEVLQYNFFEHYYDEEPLKSMRNEEFETFKKLIGELTKSNEQKDDTITNLNKVINANEQLLNILQEERARYKKETNKKKF